MCYGSEEDAWELICFTVAVAVEALNMIQIYYNKSLNLAKKFKS